MTDTLARPDRADDARHQDFATDGVVTGDAAADGVMTGGVAAESRTRVAAAAWDAWAARVDGERDIAMVLDALPRAHALMGAYTAAPLHPLAPVDGVLAAPGGVVGPFADLGRPGRPGRLGTGRHFVRVTGRRQPTSWGRLRLALLVAAALWCASNTTTLIAALTAW
ncbi:MAG: hypothetical protein ACRCY8_03505 [Dermatophilaceae bacterium]